MNWLILFEFEGDGINALAQAGGIGPVVENMSEMRATTAARDFGAEHTVRTVFGLFDGFPSSRIGETRPAASGMKLGVGTKENISAAHALVGAGGFGRFVLAGEGWLCAFLAGDIIFIRSELAFPLRIGFLDF